MELTAQTWLVDICNMKCSHTLARWQAKPILHVVIVGFFRWLWRLETVMDGDGWPSHLASSWEMMVGKGTTRTNKGMAHCSNAMRCFSSHFSWCQAFAALAFGICRGVVWHSFNRSICTWHGSGSTMFYVSGSVAARLATIWTMEKKTAWLWVAFRVCVCVLRLCATHSSCCVGFEARWLLSEYQ